MEITTQVLLLIFIAAVVLGAVANKTNFCTMGAVSDWVNMGDLGRIRAWLLAIVVALVGVLALEWLGKLDLSSTFPPYRTSGFAWLRYALGGAMFGIGMTLGSGCGNKTLVRIGGGNLKSVVVLLIAAPLAYLMAKTDFYNDAFAGWINPTTVDLAARNINSQELSTVVGGLAGIGPTGSLHLLTGIVVALALLVFIFKSGDFRASFDNILGGLVVGLVVLAGWYITGGPMGQEWKEAATFLEEPPFGVAVQSFTFINPMADTLQYLLNFKSIFITFGVMALVGVIAGSFLYSIVFRKFRIEWFVNFKDFAAHAVGGVLMGIGGVLSMGCTIGQAVTGVSTLALGSILTFVAIVFGSALTMKVQYYLLDEQGFVRALRLGLSDLKLLPKPRTA
jgi:hypothetical protein